MLLIYTAPSKTLQPGCKSYPKELAVPGGSEYPVPEAPLEAKKKAIQASLDGWFSTNKVRQAEATISYI